MHTVSESLISTERQSRYTASRGPQLDPLNRPAALFHATWTTSGGQGDDVGETVQELATLLTPVQRGVDMAGFLLEGAAYAVGHAYNTSTDNLYAAAAPHLGSPGGAFRQP